MKLLLVAALAFVAIVYAAPVEDEVALPSARAVAIPVSEGPKLLESEFHQAADGGYDFKYKISDGSAREESGTILEVPDSEDEKLKKKVVVVHGSYVQNDVEGKPHLMKYVADQNGYQVSGDLVPTIQPEQL